MTYLSIKKQYYQQKDNFIKKKTILYKKDNIINKREQHLSQCLVTPISNLLN